jgi:hypothetical protein
VNKKMLMDTKLSDDAGVDLKAERMMSKITGIERMN